MEKEYINILYQYFIKNSLWFVGALILFLIFLTKELSKQRRKKHIQGNLVFIFLLLLAISINFITIQLDIQKNDIIMVEYENAYYHPEGDPQIFVKPYWFELDKEHTVELYSVTDTPKRLENGVVIYSKHSKVLLDYTGKEFEEW